MSHQYEPFWFPECLLCGMGNLPAAVCLQHSCHEKHGLQALTQERDLESESDGHHWKGCQFCERNLFADPGAWESMALCAECWNHYVDAGRFPPTTVSQVVREIGLSQLEIGWDAATQTKVRVRR